MSVTSISIFGNHLSEPPLHAYNVSLIFHLTFYLPFLPFFLLLLFFPRKILLIFSDMFLLFFLQEGIQAICINQYALYLV